MVQFYSTAQLGPTQSVTPEGFLLCADVPVARVGDLEYGPGEIASIPHGDDGWLRVSRDADELFSENTIRSFEGKPVTLGHPPQFVTPGNWAAYAKGHMTNVRQGDGENAGVLLADLLITDEVAIKQVRDGLREVSLGYDAEYEIREPGRAVQRSLIGNHVALVVRGRCGPRCAVGDEEPKMAKRTILGRLRAALNARTRDEMEEALREDETADEAEEEKDREKAEDEDEERDDEKERTTDAARLARVLTRLETRLSAVEARMPAPATTRTNATDAAPVAASAWQEMASRAALLGASVPTFDAAPAQTADALCACQRQALTAAYATTAGRAVIDAHLHGLAPTFDSMSRDAVALLFNAAADAARRRNNSGFALSHSPQQTTDKSYLTPAGYAAMHADFWAKQRINGR